MNRKGFTLIELILVIAILGILAISALPKFLNLSGEAERASRDGVVGAVRSGIALYRANDMVAGSGGTGAYPSTISTSPPASGSACADCFDTVLANGVSDSSWTGGGTNVYTFNDGASATSFTYNSTSGTFQ